MDPSLALLPLPPRATLVLWIPSEPCPCLCLGSEAGGWLLAARLPKAASRGGRALWGRVKGGGDRQLLHYWKQTGAWRSCRLPFCAGISSSAGLLLNGIFSPNAVIIAIQILITQSR